VAVLPKKFCGRPRLLFPPIGRLRTMIASCEADLPPSVSLAVPSTKKVHPPPVDPAPCNRPFCEHFWCLGAALARSSTRHGRDTHASFTGRRRTIRSSAGPTFHAPRSCSIGSPALCLRRRGSGEHHCIVVRSQLEARIPLVPEATPVSLCLSPLRASRACETICSHSSDFVRDTCRIVR
jgi:hypothetical protein